MAHTWSGPSPATDEALETIPVCYTYESLSPVLYYVSESTLTVHPQELSVLHSLENHTQKLVVMAVACAQGNANMSKPLLNLPLESVRLIGLYRGEERAAQLLESCLLLHHGPDKSIYVSIAQSMRTSFSSKFLNVDRYKFCLLLHNLYNGPVLGDVLQNIYHVRPYAQLPGHTRNRVNCSLPQHCQ